MKKADLYYHSFDVEYVTDPEVSVNHLDLVFPTDVVVPANSLVDIDMKIRVNLFLYCCSEFNYKLFVTPKQELTSTPLMYAVPGMSVLDGQYASDLFIQVRNLSNTDYTITAGSSLFCLTADTDLNPLYAISVPEDHISMELKPVDNIAMSRLSKK